MIQKPKQTKKMDYWIHVNGIGFTYFHSERELCDFVINNNLESEILRNKVACGPDSMDHKVSIASEFPVATVFAKYAISHDVQSLNAYKSRKRVAYLHLGSKKKHWKGYFYRNMKTLQEKRMQEHSVTSEKLLRQEFGVNLKKTRNAKLLKTSWSDSHGVSQNNWKTSTKKARQWMRHK